MAGRAAEGCHGDQPGVRLYLHAPGVVVDEVPVEDVELLHGHDIEELFCELFSLHVAGAVEHHAAPGVAGGVGDVEGGHGPTAGEQGSGGAGLHFDGQELTQRLHSVEGTGVGLGFDGDGVVGYGEVVAFVAQLGCRVGKLEGDGAGAGGGVRMDGGHWGLNDREGVAGGRRDDAAQEIGRGTQRGVGVSYDQARLGNETEEAVLQGNFRGNRNDRDGRYGVRETHGKFRRRGRGAGHGCGSGKCNEGGNHQGCIACKILG